MVVNRAQAYKWMGDDAKCAEITNGEDWSASGDAFQLADAVLRDDVERAVQIMKRLGDTHELMIKQAYREWPLFRKMRVEELFSLDYARGADFGGDTGATVWYKRSAHNVLATTEAPA